MTLDTVGGSRRARHWFGVLVLLTFALKALMPTGVMFAAVDGHTRLVMCPAGLYHTMTMRHAHGMNQSMDMTHAAHGAALADQCPFALAGGAALYAATLEVFEPYFVYLRPAAAVAVVSIAMAPPWRHHAPRGPPALA